MSLLYFSPKDPAEVLVLAVDFTALMGEETVTSATWVITNKTTPAEDTSTMLSGAVDITGKPIIRQKVVGGTAGCSYLHRVSIVTSGGRTLTQGVQQEVSLGA